MKKALGYRIFICLFTVLFFITSCYQDHNPAIFGNTTSITSPVPSENLKIYTLDTFHLVTESELRSTLYFKNGEIFRIQENPTENVKTAFWITTDPKKSFYLTLNTNDEPIFGVIDENQTVYYEKKNNNLYDITVINVDGSKNTFYQVDFGNFSTKALSINSLPSIFNKVTSSACFKNFSSSICTSQVLDATSKLQSLPSPTDKWELSFCDQACNERIANFQQRFTTTVIPNVEINTSTVSDNLKSLVTPYLPKLPNLIKTAIQPISSGNVNVIGEQKKGTNDFLDNALLTNNNKKEKIAFISAREHKNLNVGYGDIYVINSDGTEETKVKSGFAYNPKISPNQKRILFHTGYFESIIKIIDIDGKNEIEIDTNYLFGEFPSWSPDGTKIVFSGIKKTILEEENLYIYDINSKNLKQLTNYHNISIREPSWSPDGSKIIYWNNVFKLFVLNLVDNSNKEIIDISSLSNHIRVRKGISWSSDSTEVVLSLDVGEKTGIYKLNINNKNVTPLFEENSISDNNSFCCSQILSDNKSIIFPKKENDLSYIYFLDLKSLKKIKITSSGYDSFPSLSPISFNNNSNFSKEEVISNPSLGFYQDKNFSVSQRSFVTSSKSVLISGKATSNNKVKAYLICSDKKDDFWKHQCGKPFKVAETKSDNQGNWFLQIDDIPYTDTLTDLNPITSLYFVVSEFPDKEFSLTDDFTKKFSTKGIVVRSFNNPKLVQFYNSLEDISNSPVIEIIDSGIYKGALQGDVSNITSGLGDITTSLFLFGDLRDVVLQPYYLLIKDDKGDILTLLFAGAGVLSQVNPELDLLTASAKSLSKVKKFFVSQLKNDAWKNIVGRRFNQLTKRIEQVDIKNISSLTKDVQREIEILSMSNLSKYSDYFPDSDWLMKSLDEHYAKKGLEGLKEINRNIDNLINYVNVFSERPYKVGNVDLVLGKSNIQHILERHHPNYWNSTTTVPQSFFDESLSPDDIIKLMENIMDRNSSRLNEIVTEGKGMFNGEVFINGVKKEYQFGVITDKDSKKVVIGQFFIK